MPIPKEDFDYSDSESDTSSKSGSESGSIKGGFDDDDDDMESIASNLDDDDDADIENPINEEENEYNEDEEHFSNFGSDNEDNEDEDDEEDEDINYLQKFNEQLKTNVITEHHPELIVHNFSEVEALCHVVRDADGSIIDPLHRTVPFVTKYEKAKILGERAKQLNAGAVPMVQLDEHIIDGYLIALAEFEQKKIPFIIRRPLPNNSSEYWRLQDLEIL
jgi:DNA-directed RNA polymerase subunit K/omega